MISNSLGQRRKWVPCKHVLCFKYVMFCGQFKSFIHFPTWSCDEVCCLLNRNVTLVYVGVLFKIVNSSAYLDAMCLGPRLQLAKDVTIRFYKWFPNCSLSILFSIHDQTLLKRK
jgi:hypothetical protein